MLYFFLSILPFLAVPLVIIFWKLIKDKYKLQTWLPLTLNLILLFFGLIPFIPQANPLFYSSSSSNFELFSLISAVFNPFSLIAMLALVSFFKYSQNLDRKISSKVVKLDNFFSVTIILLILVNSFGIFVDLFERIVRRVGHIPYPDSISLSMYLTEILSVVLILILIARNLWVDYRLRK
jgi:hypothetical protein